MTEPGLYWATNSQGGPVGVMKITEAGTAIFHHLEEHWCGTVEKSCYDLGPRIPSAEEIEGWQEWPCCPECGELLHYWPKDTKESSVWIWECEAHGPQDVETRCRVKT